MRQPHAHRFQPIDDDDDDDDDDEGDDVKPAPLTERAHIRAELAAEGEPPQPQPIRSAAAYVRRCRRIAALRCNGRLGGCVCSTVNSVDHRLLAAGWNILPPRQWLENLHAFLLYWQNLAPRPQRVGSCFNPPPEHAAFCWYYGYPVFVARHLFGRREERDSAAFSAGALPACAWSKLRERTRRRLWRRARFERGWKRALRRVVTAGRGYGLHAFSAGLAASLGRLPDEEMIRVILMLKAEHAAIRYLRPRDLVDCVRDAESVARMGAV